MVGLVGGAQPSLPPADDPVPESLWQLQVHAAATLRQAALSGSVSSIDLPYAQIAVRSIPAGAAAPGLGGDWHEAIRLPDDAWPSTLSTAPSIPANAECSCSSEPSRNRRAAAASPKPRRASTAATVGLTPSSAESRRAFPNA